jgi:hypothetical protein
MSLYLQILLVCISFVSIVEGGVVLLMSALLKEVLLFLCLHCRRKCCYVSVVEGSVVLSALLKEVLFSLCQHCWRKCCYFYVCIVEGSVVMSALFSLCQHC